MREQVMWISPRAMAPMLPSVLASPAVLAFTTDDFMDELEAALAGSGLDGFRARHTTWRDEQPETFPAPTALHPTAATDPIKLYQPAHGRHYLVAAHLVCRRYGQPDRRLSATESVSFVVRRVIGGHEHAWTRTDGRQRWVRVGDVHQHQPGEELLPMAPTIHRHGDRRSRLLTGLVPVSAREKYEARSLRADTPPGSADADVITAGAAELALRSVVGDVLESLAGEITFEPTTTDLLEPYESELLELALVDLLDWLAQYDEVLPAHVADEPTGLVSPFETWGAVLDDVAQHRADILGGSDGSVASGQLRRMFLHRLAYPMNPDPNEAGRIRLMDVLLTGFVEPAPPPPPPDEPDDEAAGEYVFRTVYQRTDCVHERPAWVSSPTERFRFANFFDPDAPARPVQIALPFDTSTKGLRQFPRNVKVILSEQLRGQMDRIGDDFEERDGKGFTIGEICSLSIPIITICALILLMIMVSILNFIFWWQPFFKICIPKTTVDP